MDKGVWYIAGALSNHSLCGSGSHYVRWKRQSTAPCVVMHVVSLCVQCSYETCLCYLSVVVLLAFAFLDAT